MKERAPEGVHGSSRIATSRCRIVSSISYSSATCFSAVAASGASVKSMNLAGVVIRSTLL
jgi:hypothetical protein